MKISRISSAFLAQWGLDSRIDHRGPISFYLSEIMIQRKRIIIRSSCLLNSRSRRKCLLLFFGRPARCCNSQARFSAGRFVVTNRFSSTVTEVPRRRTNFSVDDEWTFIAITAAVVFARGGQARWVDREAQSSATVRRGLGRKFPEAWKPRRPAETLSSTLDGCLVG